jgi:nucleoside-diphosphate-sugar epimerase
MAHTKSGGAPVLVTGAGGFIGRHLTLELLDRGGRVRALDVQLDALRALPACDRLELLEGDVVDASLQRRALDGVEVVYHLAAAHLGAAVTSEDFSRVNVDGLKALTRQAIEAGVQRFVHCSSVGVYGRLEHPPADEDSECNPKLPYERTKYLGEGVALDAARELGLPAVVLRPTWVYGPGCPRTEKLFRAISKGRFLVAGDGSGNRHSIYIRDMLGAFLQAGARRDCVGEVFVIGDRRAVTIRELVDQIARRTGAASPRSVPMPLMAAGATALELAWRVVGGEPPISRRTLEFFEGNTAFRVDRARERLGWEPRYDLSTGLAETFDYWARGEFWRLPLGVPPGSGVVDTD